MNQKIKKEIQDRLGKLLAESPLHNEVKKVLLDNIDKIPDYRVFDLIDALEKEKIELERIALDIKLFLEQQNEDWRKLEEKQAQVADATIEEELKRLEDEFRLEEARNSLNS